MAKTVNYDQLAPKINTLYNDVMQYKSTQTIGSHCSKVFDLECNPGYDISGVFFDDDTTTSPYRERASKFSIAKQLAFTPITKSGMIGPAMLRVEGTIEGTDIQQLYRNNLFFMSYIQGAQYFELGSLSSPPITRNFDTKVGCKMRYIKVGINGSSANNSNHWVEIQAFCYYGPDGTDYSSLGNVARGKTVTGQNVSTTTNISRVTDGTITNSNYFDGGAGSYRTVTVDLGQNYYVDTIMVWLYYGDGRTYKNFTVSTGTSNVSGTADLADVWVKDGTSTVTNGNVWMDDSNCQYAQLIRTGGHANLKFTMRYLDDGCLKIDKIGRIVG